MILALNENSIAMNSSRSIRRHPSPGGFVTPDSPPCVGVAAAGRRRPTTARIDGQREA